MGTSVAGDGMAVCIYCSLRRHPRFRLSTPMQHIAKEVREYLRAGDILTARLQTEKELSAEGIKYLESYTERITSLIKLCQNT